MALDTKGQAMQKKKHTQWDVLLLARQSFNYTSIFVYSMKLYWRLISFQLTFEAQQRCLALFIFAH